MKTRGVQTTIVAVLTILFGMLAIRIAGKILLDRERLQMLDVRSTSPVAEKILALSEFPLQSVDVDPKNKTILLSEILSLRRNHERSTANRYVVVKAPYSLKSFIIDENSYASITHVDAEKTYYETRELKTGKIVLQYEIDGFWGDDESYVKIHREQDGKRYLSVWNREKYYLCVPTSESPTIIDPFSLVDNSSRNRFDDENKIWNDSRRASFHWDMSPDGNVLYYGTPEAVCEFSIATNRILSSIPNDENFIDFCCVGRDEIVVINEKQEVIVFIKNSDHWRKSKVAQIPSSGEGRLFKAPNDRTLAYLERGNPVVYLINIDAGKTSEYRYNHYVPQTISFTPDGNRIIVGMANGCGVIWKISSERNNDE